MNRKQISDLVERLPGLSRGEVEAMGDFSELEHRALLARTIFEHLSVNLPDGFTSDVFKVNDIKEVVNFNWGMVTYMKWELEFNFDKMRFCNVCLRSAFRQAIRRESGW